MADGAPRPVKARGASAPSEPLPAIRDRFLVVDDFLPIELAQAMRAGIDAHFADPQQHTAETHQVWNYWFVPELYAYLRTKPEKVIEQDTVQQFHDALRNWAMQTLGLGRVSWPYLSLYVPGCRQTLHNDSVNGRFGFVYSLTRNERQTIGGDTIVHHEGESPCNLSASPRRRAPVLWTPSAPRFNRLVIFDDRLPHAVERVEGSMDPVEGRFVLHGHISESGPAVAGALHPDAVVDGYPPGDPGLHCRPLPGGLSGPAQRPDRHPAQRHGERLPAAARPRDPPRRPRHALAGPHPRPAGLPRRRALPSRQRPQPVDAADHLRSPHHALSRLSSRQLPKLPVIAGLCPGDP